MKKYIKDPPCPSIGDKYPWPGLSEFDCGFDCGEKIGDFFDDCGVFYVKTQNGYVGICKNCWTEGGYNTAER